MSTPIPDAFPSPGVVLLDLQTGIEHQQGAYAGMTLRDYFAAKAMQAYVSGHIAHYGHDNFWRQSDMASEAYGVADAMLKARSE